MDVKVISRLLSWISIKVRARAAFKAGETRNEVLARFDIRVVRIWLKQREKWPYIVNTDMTSSMLVDESYWTGGVNADAENYPVTATSILDSFCQFYY